MNISHHQIGLITCIFFVPLCNLSAQLTPANDPHWQILYEDNFNALNTAMWNVKDNWDNTSAKNGVFNAQKAEVHVFRKENVWVSDGNLVLRVKKETYKCPAFWESEYFCNRQYYTHVPYEYTAGMIESKPDFNFKYGFIEARVKIPAVYGLWPSFWTFRGNGVPNTYNATEIDIYEMNGDKGPTKVGTNLHMNYCPDDAISKPCPSDNSQNTCEGVLCLGEDINIPSYDNVWMVWGLEWTPSTITWYLDGKAIRVSPNPGIVAPVKTYLGMGVTQWALPRTTTYEHLMYVDYIRFYKLRNHCNTTTVISACDYNPNTHPDNVVKSISVGGNGCHVAVNSSTNVVFRATDYIELKGGFSLPTGSSFYGIVEPCY